MSERRRGEQSSRRFVPVISLAILDDLGHPFRQRRSLRRSDCRRINGPHRRNQLLRRRNPIAGFGLRRRPGLQIPQQSASIGAANFRPTRIDRTFPARRTGARLYKELLFAVCANFQAARGHGPFITVFDHRISVERPVAAEPAANTDRRVVFAQCPAVLIASSKRLL